jgi:porin
MDDDGDGRVRGKRGQPRLAAFASAHWRWLCPGLLIALLLTPGAARRAEAESGRQESSLVPAARPSAGPAGLRAALEQRGLAFEFGYTLDHFAVAHGGRARRSERLENLDLGLRVDAGQLAGWNSASFLLRVLENRGGSPTAAAGDAQVIDNLDAPPGWRLYEAWLCQSWSAGHGSLLAGLYDLNGEFDALATSALFLNSAHGMGSEFGQSGRNGPSAFPTTSLALRVNSRLGHGFGLQAAALDGVPGDPDDPDATRVQFSSTDGALLVAEADWTHGEAGSPGGRFARVFLGGWHYTGSFGAVGDNEGDPLYWRGSSGVYAATEGLLLRSAACPTRELSGWIRLGVADDAVNRFDSYLGAGLVCAGPWHSRAEDRLGVAVAIARNGVDFLRARRAQDLPVDRVETAFEGSCQIHVTPWLDLQPDVQWIVSPNTDPGIPDALALGMRVQLSF